VGGAPRWRAAFLRSQPRVRSEALERMFDRVGRAIGSYVRGALLQALIAGLSSWIVLLILGVPYAAPLAVVIFVLDLVPLVGATLGAILVGIVTLFADFPTSTIVWTVWSIVYQQVENSVIQPQIQRRATDVHPFLVLVAVLFGSTLLGVVGALVAVPAAASLQIIFREWLRARDDARIMEGTEPGAEAAVGHA
jgi:predicted PurR-regulated permease PerM